MKSSRYDPCWTLKSIQDVQSETLECCWNGEYLLYRKTLGSITREIQLIGYWKNWNPICQRVFDEMLLVVVYLLDAHSL
jgi:hypothetical protein